MISFISIPFTWALLTDADLQLCAAKTFVSIPDSFSSSLIYLDNVSLLTGLCGFSYEITSSFTSSLASSFRGFKYDNKQLTKHNFILPLYAL